MKIFVLFYYAVFIYANSNQEKITKNRFIINPDTNFNDYIFSTFANNNKIEFIIFNTSYSHQMTIDLTSSFFISHNFSRLSFKSMNNQKQYIFLKTKSSIQINLSFHSTFVTFSLDNLFFKNLTLFNSPICSNNSKINLTADFFQSDFKSIPKTNVSSIYVNKEFIFIDNNYSNHEKHAMIILSPKAKQKFTRYEKETETEEDFSQNINIHELKELIEKVRNEQINSEKVHLLNERNLIEDIYLLESTPVPTPVPTPEATLVPEENDIDFNLNSSLINIEIYIDKIIATYENLGQEEIMANSTGHLNIYTDSKSLTLKYSSDGNIFNILHLSIFLELESFIIFDQSWKIFGDQVISNIEINHQESNLLILMTDLDEVPYVTVVPMVNVRYIPERLLTESYCLCTNNRIEQCIENRECFLYSVPISNYYSSSNSIISDIVANSKASTINLYLTSNEINIFHQFLIKPFFRGRKTLNFISVVPSGQVNLVLFDLSEKIDRNKVIVNCVDVSNVMVSMEFENSVDTLILKNSPLFLIQQLSIHNFISDAYSLSHRQANIVYIIESLIINKADWNTVGINFMLKNDAYFYIQQISMFPGISLSQSHISFTGNEGEFSVGFEGNCKVKISEITNRNPTIIFSCDTPYNTEVNMVIEFLLENSLIVDFQNAIPFPNGLEIYFIPNEEVLTSLELIMINNKDYSGPSYHMYPFGNITGNIDLILSTSETVRAFMNSLINNDFSVFNLSQMSMNFNDNLVSVTFYDESIVAKAVDVVGYSLDLQFDRLFITGQMTIITNTSDTVTIALNVTGVNESVDFDEVEPELTSKMQNFVLKSTNEKSSVFFDDSFLPFLNNSVLSKIKIDHGTNDVELMTNLTTIPNIEIIDDVAGVLYYARLNTVHLSNSYNETENCYNITIDNNEIQNLDDLYVCNLTNYRSGPNLTVYIEKSGIIINQNQFLAENITFIGEKFSFISQTKSRANYNFINISSVTIIPTERSIESSTNYEAITNITEFYYSIIKKNFNIGFFLNLTNNNEKYGEILADEDQYPYSYEVLQDTSDIFSDIYYNDNDHLGINLSLFSNFFRAKYLNLKNTPIEVEIEQNHNVLFLFNNLESDLESLSKLDSSIATVATDIFTLKDDRMRKVTINGKSLSGTNKTEKNEDSKQFVTSSLFIVHYESSEVFYVSLLSKEISSKFFFIMESLNSVHIFLDNSWYQAQNAELVTFVIINANKNKRSSDNFNVTIETELYELPNVRVVDSSFNNISYSVKLYNPVFDANMSFYIFISLAAAVAIISIVFMCISIFCAESYNIEDEKTMNELSSSSKKSKSKSKMKISATENNSTDSSYDESRNINNNSNIAVPINDDSNNADDESTGMSLNIEVDELD